VALRYRLSAALLLSALACSEMPARATAAAAAADAALAAPENFAIHGQLTYTEQAASDFYSPYTGPNSLPPKANDETVDLSLFMGARMWSGAQIWINPEIDQGFGLNGTLGVAGFPSGEAYRVGEDQPYLRLPRMFVRQTLNLDDNRESVEPAQMQLGGSRSPNRWVFTLGKIAVPDIFDTNRCAHDSRNDFLNWAALDAGSFDYAADAWGYTVGAAAERYKGSWALRFGIFDLSNIPNSTDLEPAFHEFQYDAEIEKGFDIGGRPGKVRLTAFDSRGRMGLLDEAVALAESTGMPVNIAAVRQYRSRLGASLNLEQELAADLGVFARVGKAAGNVEAYEFTEIDRTLSAGMSLQGARWARAEDTVGLAGIMNGISAAREQYLNAGGLGILIGDGKLPHPGNEKIIETYYSLALLHLAHLTFDYQYIVNPAYNRDRGPVSIYALRLHAEF